MKNKPKLLIIGQGRHGKDTMAEILRDNFGYNFLSSSWVACEKVVWPILSHRYDSITDCYNDRHNHRVKWFKLICEYNNPDKARLAKDVISISNCYVGMRSIDEYIACKEQRIFDLVIWVDAQERVGTIETTDSNELTKDLADIIIENNSSKRNFEEKIFRFGKTLNL